MRIFRISTALLAAAGLSSAFPTSQFATRQDTPGIPGLPTEITDYKTIKTKRGPTIRYKEPGKAGVCETTPGVNSYAGYIDLDEKNHIYFWFQESRKDPANDDLTLFLQGGPGSDSILGMFEELGACRIDENLNTVINPWSFSNVSNMLYISQPVGVGFSYQDTLIGSLSNMSGTVLSEDNTPEDSVSPLGRYGILDSEDLAPIGTSDEAASAGFEIVQAFISGMEQFDGVKAKKPKQFHIWGESYGGHWGPAFMDHFYDQNRLIENGTIEGYAMKMGALGLINPFVNAAIQDPWGPEFAINNNFGIKALNETQYEYAYQGMNGLMGCATQIELCKLTAMSVKDGYVDGFVTAAAAGDEGVGATCSKAMNMCRDNVELVYTWYSGRGFYDIRHPQIDPTPPLRLTEFVKQAHIQQAIGVDLNYTGTGRAEVLNDFTATGDWVYPNSLRHIENLLEKGVRVVLAYGDADYGANWMGGEALSKAINYTNAEQFVAAGYQPLQYAGKQYGEVREHENLAFVRVYDAGHLVPYYQPQAAFALHNRTIHGRALADGLVPIADEYSTTGPANSTRTQTVEDFPSVNQTEELVVYAAKLIAEYDAKFQILPDGEHY